MSAQNRPLSPHLQVYRPQMTSMLSICHRAMGVALAFGVPVLVYWLVAAASGPAAYATAMGLIGSWIGLLFLFGWSIALFYHLCNGIRHLFWDAGFGFALPDAYRSGYAVLAGTVVLTLISWIAGFAGMGAN